MGKEFKVTITHKEVKTSGGLGPLDVCSIFLETLFNMYVATTEKAPIVEQQQIADYLYNQTEEGFYKMINSFNPTMIHPQLSLDEIVQMSDEYTTRFLKIKRDENPEEYDAAVAKATEELQKIKALPRNEIMEALNEVMKK